MLIPQTKSVRSSIFSLTLLLTAAHGTTQIAPVPLTAPPEVLSEYGLAAGNVQDLVLPLTGNTPFQARVFINGATRTLNLRPHDIRSKDFRLLVDDGISIRQVPTPASVTYRGEVAGAPASSVSASLINGQLDAVVHLHGEAWGVQPLSVAFPALKRSAHIVYRETDRIYRGETCGTTTEQVVPTALVQGGALKSAAIKEAELALDLDNIFYTSSRFGQGNVTTAQNSATTIVNGCTNIYRRDVSVQFAISTIIVRTSAVYSGSIQTRLSQFRSRWRANHTNVRRDLAHLFSGQGGGGVIGVASLGVVCSISNGFGASQVGFSGSRTSQISLVNHEMGHQFSAGHCNGASGGCRIMCSSIGGCGSITSFAPVSMTRIFNYAQGRSCLTTVSQNAPTLSSVTPTTYTSHQPQGVTLNGTDLDSVTSVQLGATTITTFSSTPTTLNFALPSPRVIGGPYSVTATNPVGISNAVTLSVIGNHPSVLETPTVHFMASTEDYIAHTDAGWVAVYFVSTQFGPSVLPGFVNFEIGNGFTSGPFQIVALAASPSGDATLSITMPVGAPAGQFLYWQLVTYNPASPTLPAETSNSAPVITF